MADDIELIQFRYSPYNEKVRWALDLGRVAHRRRSVLPGPHMRLIRRLTGQTATPILRLDNRWLSGSNHILAALSERFPSCGFLLPGDPTERTRALEIQSLFDEEFGPSIRRAVLSITMQDLGYLSDMFSAGRSGPVRAGYRLTMPLAAGLIRKGNGLNEPNAYEHGMETIGSALGWVETHTGPGGYLVGDSFSVADLTAASMLAAVANPPASPVARPEPMPDPLATWLGEWHHHPGARWVRDIYAKHRGLAHDFEGPSEYAAGHA